MLPSTAPRPHETALWTSRIVVPDALSRDDAALWRELCDTRPSLRSPFYSIGFVRAVAFVHPDVYVCALEREGRRCGFFAFQFASRLHRRLGIAERVGGEMSDYFGLVATPDARVTASQLLALARLTHFTFTHLDETQRDHGLAADHAEVGLRIELPNGAARYWDDLRRRDPKLAADTDRRTRSIERAYGPLRLRFQEPRRREALEHLVDEKRRQYRDTGVSDALASPWKRRLLARLATTPTDPDCEGVLSTLYAGETWVASHFGLRRRGTLHYWFPVYNHGLRQFAPGRLLLTAVLRAADSARIDAIDRGAGASTAKQDFATSEHQYWRGSWYRRSVSALSYEALLSVRWRAGALRRFSRA